MWEFINRYIMWVFLAVLTFTITMALFVVFKVANLQQEITMIGNQVNKIQAIWQIKENILLQVSEMNNYLLTGKQEYLTGFRHYTPLNIKLQSELTEVIRDSRKPLARQLSQSYEKYIDFCENHIVSETLKGAKISDNVKKQAIDQGKTVADTATQIQNLRIQDTFALLAKTVTNSRQASLITITFTLVGTLLGAGFSIVVGSRFIRNYQINTGILSNTRNITLTINEKGNITSYNKKAREFFHLADDSLLNERWEKCIGEGRLIGINLPINKVIQSGMGICNLERVFTAADGWQSVLTVDCLPLKNQPPSGVLVVARDISERKLLEEKLYAMTQRDGLTGLFNHAYLKRRLHEEINKARINHYHLSFMLLDIDNFKFYNDRFGHLAGDQLLQEFAKLIAKSVRPKDIVARYGGDEFAVILQQAGRETATLLAERIRSNVEEYPFINKEFMPRGKFTVCVGVSIYPDDALTGEEMIRLADEAMYRGKRNSKNEIQLYSSALRDLQKEIQQSEKARFNLVQVILGLINAKDRDTYLHLEKVAEYVKMICQELKLNESESKEIILAAFLHDVGKIEIPRTILNKIEPLTRDEWSLIRQHPKWGASMVRSMQSLDKVIPMIMHHHERFDGNGYPDGLKGEQIPLGSRIIAVADSFDAITNSRPYREALTYQEALKEIKRCSGTQFDPYIVELFERAFLNRKVITLRQTLS
ncbi:hypothetical protein JCM39194_02370 [Desulfotomaculum varum]